MSEEEEEMHSEWIDDVQRERVKISEWAVKDRLSIVSKLMFMNASIASSVTGWNSWLTNVIVMDKLSEDELKDLVQDFEKLAITFLDLDLKYTKILKKRSEEEQKKEKQIREAKARENSKVGYRM